MGMLARGGCHDQAKSGFTTMLLSCASVVGEMSSEIVHKSMETVPTRKYPNSSRKHW